MTSNVSTVRLSAISFFAVLSLASAGCGSADGTDLRGSGPAVADNSSLQNEPRGWHDDDDLGFAGAIYAMTNGANENTIVHYGRRRTGELVALDTTSTGGKGVGSKFIPLLTFDIEDPLLSQYSLVLRKDHRILVATNPGDDTVSALFVGASGTPILLDRQPTGGRFPVTATIHDDLVYVGHAGDFTSGQPATVTGFRLTWQGKLEPIAGSTQSFGDPSNSRVTSIGFSPDGRVLIVVDIFQNTLFAFPVNWDGSLGPRVANASSGQNPFGMAFVGRDGLLVTETQNLVPSASTISSYRLEGTHLEPLTKSLADGQTASCWISVAPNLEFAYSSNAPSFVLHGDVPGTVSALRVSRRDDLTLISGDTAERPGIPGSMEDSGPVDSVVSEDGRFFYQQFNGLGLIAGYRIGSDGLLTSIGDTTGLPVLSTEGMDGF